MAEQLTLGDLCDVEARVSEPAEGPPPTEQELAQLEELKAKMAPVLEKVAAVAADPRNREGLRIYKRLPKAEQARWASKRPADLIAHVQLAVRHPKRRARPRRSSTRRRARAPTGAPDREAEPPLEVVSPAEFRRVVDVALGGAA